MKTINQANDLSNRIARLQLQKKEQFVAIKAQMHVVYESIKPINIIKNTLHDVAASPEIKGNLINNAIGLTTGFISKKILIGSTHNPIKKLLGTVLQFTVAKAVTKNSETIKAVGFSLMDKLLKKSNNRPPNGKRLIE